LGPVFFLRVSADRINFASYNESSWPTTTSYFVDDNDIMPEIVGFISAEQEGRRVIISSKKAGGQQTRIH